MYSELEMVIGGISGGKAEINGDDTQVGFHLSGHYEFNDETRVGIYYRSEFDMEYSGGFKVDFPDFARHWLIPKNTLLHI